MGEPGGEDEFRRIGEDRRLDQLDERLVQLEASEAKRTGRDNQGQDPNYRMGNRVLADLIGGIAGGALVGWVIDRLFDTRPWGLMIFLFLGIIVAFRNIIRIAGGSTQSASGSGDERQDRTD